MSARVITGRHVLYGVIAFFGTVFAANAVFIFLALDTFTGLSTEDPYQRGLAYNQTLEARAAQRALGWNAEVWFSQTNGGQGRLNVMLRDRAGQPLEDLSVMGQVRRPTNVGYDQDVILTRSGPGAYASEMNLPLLGQWDVRLTAQSRSGARFEMERRIWLK